MYIYIYICHGLRSHVCLQLRTWTLPIVQASEIQAKNKGLSGRGCTVVQSKGVGGIASRLEVIAIGRQHRHHHVDNMFDEDYTVKGPLSESSTCAARELV